MDRNGVHHDVPKCECSKHGNCSYYCTYCSEQPKSVAHFCNCDADPLVQEWQEDVSKVTNKTLLPIKKFEYDYMRGRANVTIGKLFCKGGELPLNME